MMFHLPAFYFLRLRKKHADGFTPHLRVSAGFTLIEVIVSFFILTTVVIGFVTLVALSMHSFRNSRARYIGAKIAEEGIEMAINKRDNNVLCAKNDTCSLSSWKDDLVGDWEVDATQENQLLSGKKFKNFDSSNYICIKTNPPKDKGKFGYCGGSDKLPGNYTREVLVADLNPENINVRSIVRWTNGLTSASITLEEVLFGLPDDGGGGGGSQIIPQSQLSVFSFDSQETDGEDGSAVNAIDGNTSTMWVTEWFSTAPPHPHQITLDLGGTFTVTEITYLPRQDGTPNGTIADYEVYVSSDGSTWGSPVASGTWLNNASEKTASFTGVSASFIRIRALSEVNGNPWTSAAEINVFGQ